MRTLTHVGVSVVTAGLLAIVAVACRGDDGSTMDDTTRAISDDELAMMVLALEDFGPEFASFEASEQNGLLTAEQRAENSIDSENEAANLERFGWVSGYQDIYFNPQAGQDESEVWFVQSGVDVFESAEGAADYFGESWSQLEDDVGKSKDGNILDKAEALAADLANEATSFRFRVSSEEDPRSQYWANGLAFRRGRLVAAVGIYRFEEQRLEDTLTDLARMLDERIGSVLTGDTP